MTSADVNRFLVAGLTGQPPSILDPLGWAVCFLVRVLKHCFGWWGSFQRIHIQNFPKFGLSYVPFSHSVVIYVILLTQCIGICNCIGF